VLSSADLELHPPRAASGSLDHNKSSSHRGADFGAVYIAVPETAPITGAMSSQKPHLSLISVDGSRHRDRRYYPPPYPPYPPPTPIPEVKFHKFDGSNPKLWVKHCKTYFDVYQTNPSLWVCLASMRLTGSAAVWFQTLQNPTTTMT
jgi:hypothetical protein